MKALFTAFSSFFYSLCCDTNNPSAMRAAFLYLIATVVTVWAMISVWHLELQGIPESVVTLIGLLTTAKVVQKQVEKPADSAAPPIEQPPTETKL